jgi:hypothetical protein
MTDRVLDMAVAGGTVLLAAVTAWRAFDTHRLAQSQTRDERLRLTTIVLRECATAAASDARAGESLIDIRPTDPDGFESEDRLSKDEFAGYFTSRANDYLRCEILNAGELPALNVQIALTADMPRRRPVRVTSSVFHVIEANSRRVIWFTNNAFAKVVLHSPDSVRFTPYDAASSTAEPLRVEVLRPVLNDPWTIQNGKPVIEDLDQREMKPFSAPPEKGAMVIDPAVSALIGAGLGFAGGLGSQFLGSHLAEGREEKGRLRREQRTRAALTAMLSRLHDIMLMQRDHGAVWEAYWFEDALAPIQRTIAQPNLLLDLEPDQIRSLFALVARVETAVRVMPGFVDRFAQEREEAARVGDTSGKSDDSLRYILKNVFAPSVTLCEKARVALGEALPLNTEREL